MLTGGADWQPTKILWHETQKTRCGFAGGKPRPVEIRFVKRKYTR
jgi:hypothetical protein